VIGGGSARETEADAEVEDVAPPDETGREPRAAGAAADAREKREERAAGAGPRDDASGYGRRRGRRNP
jgi:hypothetical protein